MTKPQLPNLQQTVANTILIANISNSNNFFHKNRSKALGLVRAVLRGADCSPRLWEDFFYKMMGCLVCFFFYI